MTITENVLRGYEHGAEWMIGRSVKPVEFYTEDGHIWLVGEMIVTGSPRLYRFPLHIMDATSIAEYTKKLSTTDVLNPRTGKFEPVEAVVEPEVVEPIPNHAEAEKVPETPPETPKKAKKGQSGSKTCAALTKSGKPCKGKAINGSKYCMSHSKGK